MATFDGNAAGYRLDVRADGKVRVVDIDPSDGDTGHHLIADENALVFADRVYELTLIRETRVNSATDRDQTEPAITTLSDGSYVICWRSWADYNLHAQRYDASGHPIGEETLVTTSGNAFDPAVTRLASGGYIVTWDTLGNTADSFDIYSQRFDADGKAMGPVSRVNQTTVNFQSTPATATLLDGGYVIAWESYMPDGKRDIFAQRFNDAGEKVGSEFRANTTTTKEQSQPAIAGFHNGDYLIVWSSEGQGVYGQRFDAGGNTIGGETRISNNGSDFQSSPAIAVLNDGSYVVAWESAGHIRAQRFDAQGNEIASEVRVDTLRTITTSNPTIAALTDGGYVVAWGSLENDGNGWDIHAQRYDSGGNPIGSEARINVFTTSEQFNPEIIALSSGGYVITWTSDGQDGSGEGIYARQFDESGMSDALSGIVIDGTSNADAINGGAGMQMLRGHEGNDALSGGAGNDNIVGGDDDDVLIGGVDDDYLSGGNDADRLFGNDGDDTLYGGKGIDNLSGKDGNDRLMGENGRDKLQGGRGNDYLFDSYGDDLLSGGRGNDTLDGGEGVNTLLGGLGDDTLVGRQGQDTLNGGNGADIFWFDVASVHLFPGPPTSYHVHKVEDFSVAQGDSIYLDNSRFGFVPYGALSSENFAANATGTAMDANDYIVYDTVTGNLFYDRDGSGATAQVQFAIIGTDTHPELTAGFFTVV